MSSLSHSLAGALARLRRRLDEPLLVATLAAVSGIILADTGVYHPLSAVAAIGSGIGFFLQSRNRTFLLIAVAGAFALAHDQRRRDMLDFPFASEIMRGDTILVEAEGVIDSIPKTGSDSRPGRASFFLTLTHIRQLGGQRMPTSQRIYVSARADPPPLYGDRLQLAGQLRRPGPPRNPGEFDFGDYLQRKGVIAQLAVDSNGGFQVIDSGQGNPLISSADRARRWVAHTITRDLAQRDPEVAGVLTAMTLGTRDDTRDELIDSFRTSGTLHIFAVSGLHVGLIGIILWQLLTPLPISRRTCALTIILILCSYAFVTGLRPSAVRATIMASLVLGGPLINREPRVINSLGAAGFLILAFDTNQLFLPGFQLSFAVLLALTLLHKPILALLMPLASPDPFLPHSLLTEPQRIFYKAARGVAETFAVSLAAWAGSLPLMLYHFHLVTPIAPIANLFLIPIAFCVLGTAILSTLAGGIGFASLCTILNNANFLFASTLTATAGLFADMPVPASHFYTSTPNALRPPCEITVLDLPRGGASTLIATNTRADWLIDTGNARDFRPRVATVLHEHAGVTHLDSLLLTHADAAHIGAAGDVLATFRPDTIYTPTPNNSSSTYRTLEKKLARQGGRSVAPRADQTLEIDAHTRIRVLYRPTESGRRLGDDTCIVFLLESHGWRILFTGDSGFTTEKSLLETHAGQLRADLIVRGNHSSDHSSTPDFLAAVRPVAIIANARHFEDEAPGDHIWREAAAARGIQLFDQRETGAVSIKVYPHLLTLRGFLTGQTLTLNRAR